MKIIAKISEYLADDDFTTEALASLLSEIKSAFNDATHDPEAYITTDATDLRDSILGINSPDAIRSAALRWNEDIALTLIQTAKAFTQENNPAKSTDLNALEAHRLTLNTPLTYDMRKAVLAADNEWYQFSEVAAYLPNSFGYSYFHTLLSADDLSAILMKPEDYVILEVSVK